MAFCKRCVRDEFYPKGRKRGLVVRIQVDFSQSGRLLRYSLALIDTRNAGVDNGRILGYDNAHSAARFFARMRDNARTLDRGEILRSSITLSFEDPADLREIMTPTRLRLMKQVSNQAIALSALATALSRDASAVRRDVALLEGKYLLKTSRVTNPGHGVQTLVERAAASIELSAVV